MIIPYHFSVRGVLIAMTILSILAILIIRNNSKEKFEYQTIRGEIEYLAKSYRNLPARHQGDYRYLIVQGYPYPFEIMEPNSKQTQYSIDDLIVGDTVEIYYYEIGNTHNIGLNRFTQFIDKDMTPYFIRNSFQLTMGYVMLMLCVLLAIGVYVLWRFEKINW